MRLESTAARGAISIDRRETRRRAAGGRLLALAVPLALAFLLAPISTPHASALPSSFFGFQWSGTDTPLGFTQSEPDMEAVERSGAKYWRVPISWGGIKNNGWAETDRAVELAWKHHLTIIATVGDSQLPGPSQWEPQGSDWEDFLWEIVLRYGGGGSFWSGKSEAAPIHVWEIWNEPNRGVAYLSHTADGYYYGRFLKRSSTAIHEAQGAISTFWYPTILFGGLLTQKSDRVKESGGEYDNKSVHDFLEQANQVSNLGSSFDGLSLHPYAFTAENGKAPTSWEEAVQVKNKVIVNLNTARSNLNEFFGSGKGLWITELGWPLSHGDTAHPAVPDEEMQNILLYECFDWIKAHQAEQNIQSLLYYMYRDFNWPSWDGYSGLRGIRPAEPFSQKTFHKAWYSFQSETGAAKWPVPPLAETQAATNVGSNKATLNGVVNPHGLPTGYHFEYGPVENSYTSWLPGHDVEAGWKEGVISKSWVVKGLQPNSTYHYRIVGTNENNEIVGGGDRGFKTAPEGTKFSTPTSWGPWTSGYPLQYADVNGDGKVDALGENSAGDVKAAWSNGTSFLWASTWIHWLGGYSLDFADVNADGKADVLGMNSSGDIQVGWSNGATGFLPPTSWAKWPSGYSVDFADVNADGRADAVGKNAAGDVQVGWSNGANGGSFLAPTSWTKWPSGYSFELADVNGDKRADVVGMNSSGDVNVGLSTGGSFSASSSWVSWPSGYSIAFADVNGDGKADALGENSAGDVKVGLSTGSGFATPTSWASLPSGYSVSFADADGGGKADLLGRSPAGEVQVGLSTGAKFSTTSTWTTAYTLDLADVNGDGRADALGRNSSYDVESGWSSGGGFLPPTSWASWSTAYSLDFADVNGDGQADALGENSSGDVQVAWSNGANGFYAPTSWITWPAGYSLSFADVSGDGKADALGENSAGDVKVAWSNGANGFISPTSWTTWPSGYSLDFVDVNGDNLADAVGENPSGDVKVGLSTGGGFATAASWINWPSGYSLEFGDVNGDNKVDAVGENVAGDVQVALSTGSKFSAPASWTSLPSGYSLDLADLNGDGRADVVGRSALGDVRVGLSIPSATVAEGLANMAVAEPFDGSTGSTSNFNTNWSALGWAAGSPAKGEDTSTGWRPVAAYPTVNGAFYNPTVADTGSGVAAVATMAINPSSASRYFSLWLDTPSPAGTRAGYELRFTNVSANTYSVALSKWVGGTQTALASQSSYSFVNGNSLALVDQGGTVSAWTNTGSGFTQLLSASDTTFAEGNAGLEGSGNITRLTKFKAGSF